MRIGIVPTLSATGGGIYQYSLNMIRTLRESKANVDDYVLFVQPEDSLPPEVSSGAPGWTIESISSGEIPIQPRLSFSQRSLDFLRRSVGEGPHREGWRAIRKQLRFRRGSPAPGVELPDPDEVRVKTEMGQWFHKCGVEMMIYPAPHPLSFETQIPFVMAIHDLQHRLQPEFPEVSANGEWEWREYLFRNAARYATLLLADSEVGREDILNCYGSFGVTPEQVRVLPFVPASYLSVDISSAERSRVRTRYQLPERYLFYPAQFWPHKNHARIVRALGLLRQEYGLSIPIIFCGSCADQIREQTWREVSSLSHQLGLDREIHYLGYVPNEDVSGLYAEARALVMPTFFGPTNIPVLEAWAFGCPVLTSNIRGIREQAGDAAVLVNPRSVEDIAEGIYRLWTDNNLHQTLAERGLQRLAARAPFDYDRRLMEILEDAKMRVKNIKGTRS